MRNSDGLRVSGGAESPENAARCIVDGGEELDSGKRFDGVERSGEGAARAKGGEMFGGSQRIDEQHRAAVPVDLGVERKIEQRGEIGAWTGDEN